MPDSASQRVLGQDEHPTPGALAGSPEAQHVLTQRHLSAGTSAAVSPAGKALSPASLMRRHAANLQSEQADVGLSEGHSLAEHNASSDGDFKAVPAAMNSSSVVPWASLLQSSSFTDPTGGWTCQWGAINNNPDSLLRPLGSYRQKFGWPSDTNNPTQKCADFCNNKGSVCKGFDMYDNGGAADQCRLSSSATPRPWSGSMIRWFCAKTTR